jgi:hypothetical protein
VPSCAYPLLVSGPPEPDPSRSRGPERSCRAASEQTVDLRVLWDGGWRAQTRECVLETMATRGPAPFLLRLEATNSRNQLLSFSVRVPWRSPI